MPTRSRLPRPLTLTPAHVAKVTREMPNEDHQMPYTPLTDAEFEALAQRLLQDIGDGPFWVFAYGSLIWKPGFDYVEARRSLAHGWRRSFCLEMHHWRATPEQPGLMLALDRGGSCVGMAYRLPEDEHPAQMMRLLRRELMYQEDLQWLRWLTLRGGGEVFRALTFYCTPDDPSEVLRLPVPDQAALMARAVGHMGSCAEYLHNTVAHLEALGIRDRYLWTLQARVAAEIEAL